MEVYDMTDYTAMVKSLYDSSPEVEWARMDRNPFEFEITKRMLSLMSRFELEQLHLFAQEGIISTKQRESLEWDEQVRNKWLDVAYALCERPELLGYAEHLMYIGRKM